MHPWTRSFPSRTCTHPQPLATKSGLCADVSGRQLRANRAHDHLSPATRVRFVGA